MGAGSAEDLEGSAVSSHEILFGGILSSCMKHDWYDAASSLLIGKHEGYEYQFLYWGKRDAARIEYYLKTIARQESKVCIMLIVAVVNLFLERYAVRRVR